jgi:hypothetical protein
MSTLINELCRRANAAEDEDTSDAPEAIIFGERLWPPPPLTAYSYDQLTEAARRFRSTNEDLLRTGEGVASGARLIQQDNQEAYNDGYGPLVAPCDQFLPEDQIIFRLVDHMAELMAKDPEGECQWPPLVARVSHEWNPERAAEEWIHYGRSPNTVNASELESVKAQVVHIMQLRLSELDQLTAGATTVRSGC